MSGKSEAARAHARIDELEERLAESRETAEQTFHRRSAAAKRGAETRRRNAAK
jgi:hypothetical protein